MIHKAPLQFLIILMGFSIFISSSPLPRSLLLNKEKSSNSIQTTLVQGAVEFRNGEGKFEMGEELMVEGRMVLESDDYPGTGANNRHDPKTPGRA